MNDETCWPKANPLLDVTVSRRYLREQVQEARDMPAKAALVARLNFCVWTESSAGAIEMERWDAEENRKPPEIPPAATVYGGLDLQSTTDLAALIVAHEADDGSIDLEAYFFCPAAAIESRSRRDHLPYDVWRDQGFITETEGDVTDYDTILAKLADVAGAQRLAEVGFVRLNATQFVTAAGAFTTMVPISQTFMGQSAATKDYLARIAAGKVRHGGNPVLRWMAANLVVDQNAGGDLKPSSDRSTERINGQIAAICAMARLAAPHDPTPPEPGILTLFRRQAAAGAAAELASAASEPGADYSFPIQEGEGPAPSEGEGTEPSPCGVLYRARGNAIAACDRPEGHPGGHGAA
jgi:phage terminase large subunit-like protein